MALVELHRPILARRASEGHGRVDRNTSNCVIADRIETVAISLREMKREAQDEWPAWLRFLPICARVVRSNGGFSYPVICKVPETTKVLNQE